MKLIPLGHRVHVKPDSTRIEQTSGGIIVPDVYADVPPMSGTVTALGSGPEHDKRIRTQAIRDCIAAVTEVDETFRHAAPTQAALEELGRVLRLDPDPEHDVQIGDRVIFPMEVGHEIVIDERTQDTVLVINEESILAIVEPEAAVA